MQKSRDYDGLLKSGNFTAKFLAGYWGENLVRSIMGCSRQSERLLECAEGGDFAKCQELASELEHCASLPIPTLTSLKLPLPLGYMSYSFPQDYNQFMECYEKYDDPATLEKVHPFSQSGFESFSHSSQECGPIALEVSNKFLAELEKIQRNTEPLTREEVRPFRSRFTFHC